MQPQIASTVDMAGSIARASTARAELICARLFQGIDSYSAFFENDCEDDDGTEKLSASAGRPGTPES
jgi:hypothetical protein